MDAHVAQADSQTSADGIEIMDPTIKTLKAALEAIRNMALNALHQREQSQEQCSVRWKCKACRYYKKFHKSCSIGNRGEMPSMQKHRI
ncbi:MAG: hypothetical protein DMG63_10335 [Acidobacteria bacterium]|nr:MAG: hypothetical protein DMG63_10335 [Acidobacteriota bacterium]